MRFKLSTLAVVCALSVLGACRTPPPSPPPAPVAADEPLTWGRKDCQRAAGNAVVQDKFARDKAYCEQDARIAEGQGVNPGMVSCMSSRGYNYSTRTSHDTYCARTARR